MIEEAWNDRLGANMVKGIEVWSQNQASWAMKAFGEV